MIVALYAHDGEELWSRTLGIDEGPFVAEFDLGASLCQTETKVFVLLEHDGPSYLLAIDKQTGKTLWKSERSPRRSWTSPVTMRIDGAPQIVVSSAGSIDGYDPESGKLLWSFADIGGNTATTPIDYGDGRFLVGASPGRNGENSASSVDSNCLIEVEREGNDWNVTRKWVAEGATPTWASPIIHQGLAYWINRAGVVFCYDASNGEKVYAERLKDSSWATPIGVGDRIYFFGKSGTVTVLAAGREFKVLAENQTWTDETLPAEAMLGEESTAERRQAAAMFSKPTLYGTAIANDSIVVRVGNCLICIR
ncbi:MAG: PQQ-binding-like beta-propeller repeat protein [Pirellulaceae bacterium]